MKVRKNVNKFVACMLAVIMLMTISMGVWAGEIAADPQPVVQEEVELLTEEKTDEKKEAESLTEEKTDQEEVQVEAQAEEQKKKMLCRAYGVDQLKRM